MTDILIIEDEPLMRLGLKDNLEFEGYHIDLAVDGKEGYEKAIQGVYDLILLDVMLPQQSGLDVCKKLRQNGNLTPVILLTARGEEVDKVLGLEIGADDYVTKPFSVRELVARIKALLRRVKNDRNHAESITTDIGKLSVHFGNYTASDGGIDVKMSHKEFEVLLYLYQHKNELVSRYDLLENVWGYEEKPTTRTVDNFIVKLRQKLEINPNQPRVILTVHGAGYKLIY
ncbi:response regulator transcription factor [Fulvivirga sp. 29W222]|uniref:Response regulator transcription factor n=1 Tax=Fulvivirga marina TaxID=2494733 RepID=A0A937FU81_9BACT|nr:response regulator transcription factor [Fulvivirga marina]MBL6446054.1 response regulator transcription factor [Fulvivirga marina]